MRRSAFAVMDGRMRRLGADLETGLGTSLGAGLRGTGRLDFGFVAGFFAGLGVFRAGFFIVLGSPWMACGPETSVLT